MVIILSDRRLREMVRTGKMLWFTSNQNFAGALADNNLEFLRTLVWQIAKTKPIWRDKFFRTHRTVVVEDSILVKYDGKIISLWDCVFYYRITRAFLARFTR